MKIAWLSSMRQLKCDWLEGNKQQFRGCFSKLSTIRWLKFIYYTMIDWIYSFYYMTIEVTVFIIRWLK